MTQLGDRDKSPRTLQLAARLAIGFGLFLAVAEVVRNWGDWGYWPFWVVDYIAVSLLLAGAWSVRAGRGPTVLAGAWGFTCAMFYASFFSHIQHITQPDHGPIEQLPLTIIIGILFALTIVGFGLSLVSAPRR